MSTFSSEMKAIAISAMAVLGCGCTSLTMAPDYQRPDAPVAETFPDLDETSDDVVRIADWRSFITDPALTTLVETALENNRDLRIAMLNVDRARALYRVQRADSLPSISADGGYLRQRIGENASIGAAGAAGGSGRTDPITIEQYSAEVSLSAYELDLFGRVRSLNRKALETYFATEEARRSAEISLIAEVAGAYLQLLADRERLTIARETVESQQSSYNLTRELVDNGLGNDLDVQRADTSVQRARADAAGLEAQIARDENALRLLVGRADLPEIVASLDGVALNTAFANVSSGILLQRPDVLATERRLRAANANIGAARAAFFPRILLTASAGTTSAELANLFSAGTGVWSFAPSVSLPIFSGGRNRAQLTGAKIDRDIAVNEYEKAVQSAFRDVADALATRRTIGERLEATEKLSLASERTYTLADARFRNGVDSYLSVLDAQRTDYAAKQELVLIRLEEAVSAINLYRALGGFPETQ